jgi:hypothetical protein
VVSKPSLGFKIPTKDQRDKKAAEEFNRMDALRISRIEHLGSTQRSSPRGGFETHF